MAKAKKSDATEAAPAKAIKAKAEPAKAPAPAKPPASKAAAARSTTKKPAAKKGKKDEKAARPAPAGTPLVDTSLAAESAARMLMGKARLGSMTTSSSTDSQKESASFKQFKESVNKPASHGPGKAAANPFAPKNALPIPGSNPIFHNQTQGGVSRINVPRRTGG
jgi:translation initiation factor IF-2